MSEISSKDIRAFLLGSPTDLRDQIEERLFSDVDFLEIVNAEEEELIQDYIDGELSPDEIKAFETHFLISEERKEKEIFSRGLIDPLAKMFGDEQATPKRTITNTATLIGLSLAVLIAIGFLAWSYILPSPSSEVLAQEYLEEVFPKSRPFSSRIYGVRHKPKLTLKGNDLQNRNKQAETEYLVKTKELSDSDSFHALGILYLTKRDFDSAITNFKSSLEKNPNNLKVLNDLSVAYIEKGSAEQRRDLRIKSFSLANDSLDKAIVINGKSPEVLFNSAVFFERIGLKEKAKESLKLLIANEKDNDWLEEAQKRLNRLDSGDDQEISSAELSSKVRAKLAKGQTGDVKKLIVENRSIGTNKYLPMVFAHDILHAEGAERERGLKELKALAFFERDQFSDRFALDVYNFIRETHSKKN